MAERKRHDSMMVHCGRCGKLLIMRLEDLRGKHTIDCDACMRPAENGLPVIRPSRAPSTHAGSGMAWSLWRRKRSWTTQDTH
jgi:hypothetical protein